MKDRVLAFAEQWQPHIDDALASKVRETSDQRVSVVDACAADETKQRSLDQGVADFMSARHAITFNGVGDDEDEDDEVDDPESLVTLHDLIGQVRPTSRVRLRTEDMTNLSVILAWWVFQQQWRDPEIRFTYRRLAEAKGVAYKGDFAKRVRRSLVRLAAWSAEMTEKETQGGERWETIGFLHYVKGHDNPDEREHGEIVAALHRSMHDRMLDRRFSLFPLQVYLRLHSDLAKELYRWLETQRGFGANGDYAITITPEFLSTIGCRQIDQRQTRFRLRRACEEIMRGDPRYIEMTVAKSAKSRRVPRGEKVKYVLTVRRQRVVKRTPLLPQASDREKVDGEIPLHAATEAR